MTHRATTANINVPHEMDPRLTFTVSSAYPLVGKIVTLAIYNKHGKELFSADSTGPMVTVSGQDIQINIPTDNADYAAVLPGVVNNYGLTVGGDFRVQGRWMSLLPYGEVQNTVNTCLATIGAVSVAVSFVGGMADGSGDMLIAVYDPTGIGSDAFLMSNMAEDTDAKVLTAAERVDIAANSATLAGGISGSFMTFDNKQITVTNGIITAITGS